MALTKQSTLNHILAEQIVAQVNQIIDKSIAICDLEGLVLASTDKAIIGSVMEQVQTIKSHKPIELKVNDRKLAITPLHFHGLKAGSLIIYDDEAWSDHLNLVKSLAELLAERHMELQVPVPESKDTIIYQLLKNEDPHRLTELSAEAMRVGFDLTLPRIVLVIRLANFWQTFFKAEQEAQSREANIDRYHNKLAQAFDSFFTASKENIVAYLGDDQFVVLKDISTTSEEKFIDLLRKNYKSIFATIKNEAITDITVGVGNYFPDLVGLGQSYREAALALELGERMWGANKVYHTNNLGIAGIIVETSPAKKLDFTDRLLGPLLPHQELIKTMEQFYNSNLNLTDAADELKIHRNTLIYRLDKITSMVGLDPRNFQEAVQIYIALLIKRILS